METKNQPVKSHQTIDDFIKSVKQGLLGHSSTHMPHTSNTQRTHRTEEGRRRTLKPRYHTPLEARRRWKLYKQYSH